LFHRYFEISRALRRPLLVVWPSYTLLWGWSPQSVSSWLLWSKMTSILSVHLCTMVLPCTQSFPWNSQLWPTQ
jgi:hypothetical protein